MYTFIYPYIQKCIVGCIYKYVYNCIENINYSSLFCINSIFPITVNIYKKKLRNLALHIIDIFLVKNPKNIESKIRRICSINIEQSIKTNNSSILIIHIKIKKNTPRFFIYPLSSITVF